MRKVQLANGVQVFSPVHTPEEAAAWLGLERRAFLRMADNAAVPFTLLANGQRRYHERDLRRWMREGR
jgi:hypothetical protein